MVLPTGASLLFLTHLYLFGFLLNESVLVLHSFLLSSSFSLFTGLTARSLDSVPPRAFRRTKICSAWWLVVCLHCERWVLAGFRLCLFYPDVDLHPGNWARKWESAHDWCLSTPGVCSVFLSAVFALILINTISLQVTNAVTPFLRLWCYSKSGESKWC